jgi:hypothetical protein
MTSSMLLLTTLLSLPSQSPVPSRPPGMYREDQRDLFQIHCDLVRLKEDATQEIMALNDQVRRVRAKKGSLLSRLMILRQSARSRDSYCDLIMERLGQWEDVYNRRPDPAVHKLFHAEFIPREIRKDRARTRKLYYMEIMYYRWSWEKGRIGINYRIADALANLTTGGDLDVLLDNIGSLDALVTDFCSLLPW